jgi:protein gp37
MPLRWKKTRMVFVISMSDLFLELVPDVFIDRVFAVMALTPQHTYQVLTKRPERMRAYLRTVDRHNRIELAAEKVAPGKGHPSFGGKKFLLPQLPLPNVWLGTSVENQRWADERIPLLLDTPAAVRFLSCEPLLAPLDLERWIGEMDCAYCRVRFASDPCPVCGEEDGDGMGQIGFAENAAIKYPDLHWIIAGGESGPGYRKMDLDWARSLRDQCYSARVAFFMKQQSGPRPGMHPHLDGMVYHQFPGDLREPAPYEAVA